VSLSVHAKHLLFASLIDWRHQQCRYSGRCIAKQMACASVISAPSLDSPFSLALTGHTPFRARTTRAPFSRASTSIIRRLHLRFELYIFRFNPVSPPADLGQNPPREAIGASQAHARRGKFRCSSSAAPVHATSEPSRLSSMPPVVCCSRHQQAATLLTTFIQFGLHTGAGDKQSGVTPMASCCTLPQS
jgi:hypothetical protein